MKTKRKLSTDKYPRYYYHISTKLTGESSRTVLLTPIDSYSILSSNRAEEEPDDARICVAPSIPHCLSAICYGYSVYHCWRTKNKIIAKYPYGVPDMIATQERWIVVPTEFVYFAELDIKKFVDNECVDSEFCRNDQCGTFEDISREKKIIAIWKKAIEENKCNGIKYLYDI